MSQVKIPLSPQERLRVVLIYSVIALVTIAGFVAWGSIGRSYLLLAGLGLVAYVFGLRHGVDADHLAAIDNTTRKLMQEGKRPLTVGAWFSLGHSTIVLGLTVAVVLATRAVVGAIPAMQEIGSVLGTTVSGEFLWLIGIVNAVIVLEVYRVFRGLREGKLNESELEELLNNRGLMNRYFGHLFKLIKKPWQTYPVGVLFGLGFDTASEVALIAISVGVGVSSSVPLWMVLILPLMFTCGMVLVDTSDGIMMNLAYGWAFLKPIRKIYYNLTVTIISVLVAFLIGGVELLQVVSGELKLNGAFWTWLGRLDFETMGFGVAVVFALCWLASMALYRYKHFDEIRLLPVS